MWNYWYTKTRASGTESVRTKIRSVYLGNSVPKPPRRCSLCVVPLHSPLIRIRHTRQIRVISRIAQIAFLWFRNSKNKAYVFFIGWSKGRKVQFLESREGNAHRKRGKKLVIVKKSGLRFFVVQSHEIVNVLKTLVVIRSNKKSNCFRIHGDSIIQVTH